MYLVLEQLVLSFEGGKTLGLVCFVSHVKEPRGLIKKRWGFPWCSWFDWQHIAPQYKVLCEITKVS